MGYVRAVVFVRPSLENIVLLQKELRDPNYPEYFLCISFSLSVCLFVCVITCSLCSTPNLTSTDFSNSLSPDLMDMLAEADEHEVVKSIQVPFALSAHT
jgi:hypothetical protein